MRTTSNKELRAIIVGHNDFAGTLFTTLQCIVGPVTGISVLSNQGVSGAELEQRLTTLLGDSPSDVIIFADLFGGSCPMVCKNLIRKRKNLAVICGVNLPMLLEFSFARGKMEFSELVTHLVNVGKEGIRVL